MTQELFSLSVTVFAFVFAAVIFGVRCSQRMHAAWLFLNALLWIVPMSYIYLHICSLREVGNYGRYGAIAVMFVIFVSLMIIPRIIRMKNTCFIFFSLFIIRGIDEEDAKKEGTPGQKDTETKDTSKESGEDTQ